MEGLRKALTFEPIIMSKAGLLETFIRLIQSGALFGAPGIVVLALLKRQLEDPKQLIVEFLESLSSAGRSCWKYVAGTEAWDDLLSAIVKPSLYALAPFLLVRLNGGGNSEPPVVPASCLASCPHTEPAAKRVVLPLPDRVYFDRAGLDGNTVTGLGVTVSEAWQPALTEMLDTLSHCGEADENGEKVELEIYGFASEERFRGLLDDQENDDRNLDAANKRAKVVRDALRDLVKPRHGVTVVDSHRWPTAEAMKEGRKSMIRIPSDSERDPVSDRVAIVKAISWGNCEVGATEATEQSEEEQAA